MIKRTILVIEDEENLLENIVEMLSIKGYNSLTAKDGRSGINSIKLNNPDLILCDIKIPGMNGYEVLKYTREELEIDSPFIFISAKAERESIRMGMTLGADDYITKPFRMDELIASVEARFKRQSMMLTDGNQDNDKINQLPEEILLILSKTERLVIDRLLANKSTKEIAAELFLSAKTITNHRYNIAKKLNLKGTHSLSRFILSKGWLK